MMPTRSPGSTPRATSPFATETTSASNSRAVSGIHGPSAVVLSSITVWSGVALTRSPKRSLRFRVGSTTTCSGVWNSSMLTPVAEGEGGTENTGRKVPRGPVGTQVTRQYVKRVVSPGPVRLALRPAGASVGPLPTPCAATDQTTSTRTDMHAIGVDIGGTKIAAGVVDEDGTILAQTRRPTEPDDAGSIDRAIADV